MTDPKPTWSETAGQLNAENGGYDDGLEDAIADALSDSLEMDWTTRDGARAVMRVVNTELAALRERVRVLDGALKPFADIDLTSDQLGTDFAWDVLRARAALKGGEHG